MSASGTATLAFGSTPVTETSVVVSMAGIGPGSLVEFWIMGTPSTGTNTTSDHDFGGTSLRLTCTAIVAGTSATCHASCLAGAATGDFTICWVWV